MCNSKCASSDAKTGEVKSDTGFKPADEYLNPGKAVIPISQQVADRRTQSWRLSFAGSGHGFIGQLNRLANHILHARVTLGTGIGCRYRRCRQIAIIARLRPSADPAATASESPSIRSARYVRRGPPGGSPPFPLVQKKSGSLETILTDVFDLRCRNVIFQPHLCAHQGIAVFVEGQCRHRKIRLIEAVCRFEVPSDWPAPHTRSRIAAWYRSSGLNKLPVFSLGHLLRIGRKCCHLLCGRRHRRSVCIHVSREDELMGKRRTKLRGCRHRNPLWPVPDPRRQHFDKRCACARLRNPRRQCSFSIGKLILPMFEVDPRCGVPIHRTSYWSAHRPSSSRKSLRWRPFRGPLRARWCYRTRVRLSARRESSLFRFQHPALGQTRFEYSKCFVPTAEESVDYG